jgi:hypothetical protein
MLMVPTSRINEDSAEPTHSKGTWIDWLRLAFIRCPRGRVLLYSEYDTWTNVMVLQYGTHMVRFHPLSLGQTLAHR